MKPFAIILVCMLTLSACTLTQPINRTTHIKQSIANYQTTMTCVTPVYRWSQLLCMTPPASGPRMSQAQTGTPHARKLYHLYVSDEHAYEQTVLGNQQAPIGTTLIKESHYPIKDNSEHAIDHETQQQTYTAGAISGLFIMSKVGDQSTPNTDNGWVYSIANPLGEIQLSGLIDSCVLCHKSSPNDRLFGLAPATTTYYQLYTTDPD